MAFSLQRRERLHPVSASTLATTLTALRRGARHIVALASVSALVLLGSFVSAGVGVAHSELESSTPADGASVSQFTEISLTFGEEITPEFSSYTLTDPMGMPVQLGTPTYDSTKTIVTVPVTALVGGGNYVVDYSVLSVDGHTVAGSIKFASTAPVLEGHDMDGMDADHSRPPHADADHDHDATGAGGTDLSGLWYALIGAGVGAALVALIAVIGKRRRARAETAKRVGADDSAADSAASGPKPAQDKPVQDKPARKKP